MRLAVKNSVEAAYVQMCVAMAMSHAASQVTKSTVGASGLEEIERQHTIE